MLIPLFERMQHIVSGFGFETYPSKRFSIVHELHSELIPVEDKTINAWHLSLDPLAELLPRIELRCQLLDLLL